MRSRRAAMMDQLSAPGTARFVRRVAVLALLAAIVGCGADDERRTLAGMVTVDSAPLADGAIRFEPVDGQGPTAGATIVDGRYQVDVAPGKKRVAIEGFRPGGTTGPNSYPGMSGLETKEQFVPEKYNGASTTEIDVTADNNALDFSLTIE